MKKLIKVAGLSRSTYYYMMNKMSQPDPDQELKEKITSLYHFHDRCYGYRRIRNDLRNEGIYVNHKKVYRIMKALGLKCQVRMKKYKAYKGKVGHIADNVLNRKFDAEKPNQKWVTDITEFKLFGEKLYLSPVLDLFNREIISYTIRSRPTYELVGTMMNQALERLNENHELLIHSDQGVHYQLTKYQEKLKENNITQSMSRRGNCYDNAVIESFFGILKSEFLYRKEFEDIEHFKQELDTYIHYYNHVRIKSKLKNMSPVKYRTHVQKAA